MKRATTKTESASKTGAMLTALSRGEKITARQAVRRFGFENTKTVRAQISKIRSEGYNVKRTYTDRTPNCFYYISNSRSATR